MTAERLPKPESQEGHNELHVRGICPGTDSMGWEVPYKGMKCDCSGCNPIDDGTKPCDEGGGCGDCTGPATGCVDYRNAVARGEF